ncbi:MAG: HD domain-containing protein [Anaerolineae bacterium]|nr:HD domain-containing protein [Anaerolineae bacterium]
MPDAQDLTVDPQAVARLAMQIPALKRAPRMGWLIRGVAPGEVESVAAHTAGVGLVALLLADLVETPIDRGRLLSICLLHDLAEAVIGDLPRPAVRYFDPGAKSAAEARALRDMLAGLPFTADWLALWRDFEDAATDEARLARDADRLDLLLQAAAYHASGRRGLDDFWESAAQYTWYFSASASLFEQLQQQYSHNDFSGIR